MTAYRLVYDSRHLQADCQEPGLAPEPIRSVIEYGLTLLFFTLWNITVRRQAINNKLQGSVATYLRCGGVVNNQIKKGLLVSLPVKKI